MDNGVIKIEAKELENKIYTEINSILAKRGSKKALSDHLGYHHQSSLTVALRDRSFKLGTLLEIMYFLDLKPMHVFTDKTRLNIEKLSLYELVKNIMGEVLSEHKKQIIEIIENNNKKRE